MYTYIDIYTVYAYMYIYIYMYIHTHVWVDPENARTHCISTRTGMNPPTGSTKTFCRFGLGVRVSALEAALSL